MTVFQFKTISDDKFDDIAHYVHIFTTVRQDSTRQKLWRKYCKDKTMSYTRAGTPISNNYWSKLVSRIRKLDGYEKERKSLLRRFEIIGSIQKPKIYFKESSHVKKRLVKKSEREDVVKQIFENPLLGSYRGRDTIYDHMKNHFFGISRNVVQKVLQEYELNQRGSAMQIKNDIPNEQIIVSRPNDYWQVDVTRFKRNYPGNHKTKAGAVKYKLLVVIDICTRFAWVMTITAKSDKEVNRETTEKQKHLRKLFRLEGNPRVLHGDNEFSGMQSLCDKFGVDLKLGKPYQHTDQACVERLHQTLKVAVARYMWDNRNGDASQSWEDYIDDVVFAYNNKPHADLKGKCPFDLYKPSSSKENVNRIIRALESTWDNHHIQNEQIDKIDDDSNKRICTINIPLPPQSETVKVIKSKSSDHKKISSVTFDQQRFDRLDEFLGSGHVFPIGTTVCFCLALNEYYHATIINYQDDNCQYTLQFVKYISDEVKKRIQKVKKASDTDTESADFQSKIWVKTVNEFHKHVKDALKETFFDTDLRPMTEKNNPNEPSTKCRTYSATTIGSPYKDNHQAKLQINVGIPFDQNVIAETLFFIMQNNKSKPWLDGFAKQIVNSYIYECDKRRADNLFGDNKHDFWTKLNKYKTNFSVEKGHKPIPFFNTAACAIKHRATGNNWTFNNKSAYESYKGCEHFLTIATIKKPLNDKVFRQISYHDPEQNKWIPLKQLEKRRILYNVIWSANEIVQNKQVFHTKKRLDAVKNFLNYVIQKFDKQNAVANLPFEPFIDRKYLYAFPIDRFAKHLFDFNAKKIPNFICWDTLLMFVYNIYDWMDILRSSDIYIAEYNKKYFDEIDRVKKQYNEMSEKRRLIQRSRKKATTLVSDSRIQRGGTQASVSIQRNDQIQEQKRIENLALYKQRIEKRYREIIAIESKVEGSKYEVNVGDIVRVKNTHIQEPQTKDRYGKSLGDLHIMKNDYAIRSADPQKLDRYNLRLKWSESLYYVLSVGRVYQFKETDGKEIRHAFISKRMGDFRAIKSFDDSEHSEYIKALLKGEEENGKNPKKIKFVLNPDVNKLARLRYILVRVTPDFMKRNGTPTTISIKQLQNEIEQFRDRLRKANETEKLDKFLPIITHRKPKKDKIRRKKEHHQNTKQVKYFYRNNLLKQLHNVILRKPQRQNSNHLHNVESSDSTDLRSSDATDSNRYNLRNRPNRR